MSGTRLGILGGTFDPVHRGHLHLARRTLRLLNLNEIHFVIATTPPHKTSQKVVPLYHRYAMLSLATSGAPAFIPSLVELEPPASPFSIHTMRKMARTRHSPRTRLYFIAGADSLLDVSQWRESKELLSSHSFVFVCRPGVEIPDLDSVLPRSARAHLRDLRGMGPRRLRQQISSEEKPQRNRIYLLELGALNVSSTRIRQLVATGRRASHLIPSSIHEYIRKSKIYGS